MASFHRPDGEDVSADPQSAGDLNRRAFHGWASAAFAGLLTGTLSGCRPQAGESGAGGAVTKSPAGEGHLCRGLNACKGQGADGQNACAGQGTCATATWRHDCAGKEQCKGRGGCGDTVGKNECKGHGGCHVPLMEGAWATARKDFEVRMQTAGKAIGAAPAAKP